MDSPANEVGSAPKAPAPANLASRTPTTPQFEIEKTPVVAPRTECQHGCGGRTRIAYLLGDESLIGRTITVAGWSKTVRKQGGALCFIALSDGSSPQNLQIVVSKDGVNEELWAKLIKCGVSCSFRVTGQIVASPAKGQTVEMAVSDAAAHEIIIYGLCDSAKFPLAKKNHSKEFLREHQHLRSRTYFMQCIMRIRSSLAGATHEFFQTRGFQYIHTPLITAADCEGAGEMFQVTTMIPESDDPTQMPVDPKTKKLLYKKDFFGKKTFLTVSGQLDVETYCMGLSDVYTFGPTFRAENSHTSRHLAEFWMIEPEMAFCDLEDNMRCAEAYLRFCVQYVLTRHEADIQWLEKNVEEGLTERLKNVAESNFGRITYTDAIARLQQEPEGTFQVKPEWGMDMGSEHERFLAEQVYKKPLIVYNYPYDIKAFYMKVNDDKKTVAAMDVLVPKIGEVVGGSQREENLEVLEKQIKDKGMNIEDYWWYRELRMYGTVPHSGFGVGFERLIMMVTGVDNIRDVIPFPRYPNNAEF
eukprot:Blabericola_migrator_1__8377@NODE_435_length_8501_cov_292_016244_g341_i0_p1_GENE_NODE_435_length_8501_cov_292_016244_g341_i0NODE_435_length_8501_cov_292_016244_g341_i0_p1_ORF_typecomplete_len528_score99_28tRNAsynt_2/PF00152_20/5_1e97tRNA_anticodon/PF01336_25/5_2e07tRNA_anticodon/PF01336_25/1_1e03tRNAsynt_2d/PF01409_20/2_9e02tRNAsynt_2d/PF01409_20/0_012_NODE_435_length_8501_cov_292_016244_g341_i060177600